MLFFRTLVVVDKTVPSGRESLNFNIFPRRLFSNHYVMWVQKVYGTHNKIELKAPNDDSNEYKITQNSSVFITIHF